MVLASGINGSGSTGGASPLDFHIGAYLKRGADGRYDIDVEKIGAEGPENLAKFQRGLISGKYKFLRLTAAQIQDLHRQIKLVSERASAKEERTQLALKGGAAAIWTADKATYFIGTGGLIKAGLSLALLGVMKAGVKVGATEVAKVAGEAVLKEGIGAAGKAVVSEAEKKAARIAEQQLVLAAQKAAGASGKEVVKTAQRFLTKDIVLQESLKKCVNEQSKAALRAAFQAEDQTVIKKCWDIVAGRAKEGTAEELGKALSQYTVKAKGLGGSVKVDNAVVSFGRIAKGVAATAATLATVVYGFFGARALINKVKQITAARRPG